MKSGNLNFLEPSGPLQACNGVALTFIIQNPIIRAQTHTFNVAPEQKMAVQQVLQDIWCKERVFLNKEVKIEVFSNKLFVGIFLK